MTRKEVKALGITDEDQISAFLNAYKGAVEDFKEEFLAKQKPIQPVTRTEPDPAPVQQPAAQQPDPKPASAPDEVEQLRRELAAERAKIEQRDRRDAVISALGAFKPKNADVLYKLLDHDKIVIENGAIKSGLEEQIKAFKTEQGYLFTDAADPKGGAEPKGSESELSMNDLIRGGLHNGG